MAGQLGVHQQRQEKRGRHSVHNPHYNSQSHLMPEYHDNPYLASLISPVRHTPTTTAPPTTTATAAGPSPAHDHTPMQSPPGLYGTLPRRRGGGEEGQGQVLSQPAAMYDAYNNYDVAGAMGGVSHTQQHLALPPPGAEFGGHAPHLYHQGAGSMGYVPGPVYATSSRKKNRKKNKSVSITAEEEEGAELARLAATLSQPDFTAPGVLSQPGNMAAVSHDGGSGGFYVGGGVRGGGSMRQQAPPTRHLGRGYGSMIDRTVSLTQYDHTSGEPRGIGGVGLVRTGSMAPRSSSGSGLMAPPRPYGNTRPIPSLTISEADSGNRAEAEGAGQKAEEPVNWEVSEGKKTLLHSCVVKGRHEHSLILSQAC